MYDEKNTDCALYGTEECRLLNSEGCLQCGVGKLMPDKQKQTLDALGRLLEAAPESVVEQLYTGSECRLCKGAPGAAECWALLDMVKDDPAGDWNEGVLKKSGTRELVLPLQVCACKDCRRRYRLMEFLPTVAALVIVFAGLLLTTWKTFYKQAYDVASWLPVLIFAAFVGLALLVGFLLRRTLAANCAKHMHTDVGEIDAIAELKANGFREAAKPTAGVSKLIFSNRLRKHGVYTAMPKAEGGVPNE